MLTAADVRTVNALIGEVNVGDDQPVPTDGLMQLNTNIHREVGELILITSRWWLTRICSDVCCAFGNGDVRFASADCYEYCWCSRGQRYRYHFALEFCRQLSIGRPG